MLFESLISLKNLTIIPELFLGMSIIYILLHSTILSTKQNYLLIHNSILYLGVLVLVFVFYLLINDLTLVISVLNFNNTIINDSLSNFSKQIIVLFSIICLIIIQQYLKNQKINHFEYVLLLLFSILGLLLLCSSNDLLTAYLTIELQSLSFYVMAAFKKNSSFSIESGLKYFVLGAFSSGLFLLGSSYLYGITGSTNFEDYKDLFFWVSPGKIEALSDFDEYLRSNPSYAVFSSLIVRTSYQYYKLSEADILFIFNYLKFVAEQYDLNDYVYMFLYDLAFKTAPEHGCSYLRETIFTVDFMYFVLLLIFISLFFKLALVPFHIWLPDVYEGAPSSSTMFFAVLPKLGIFTLLLRFIYNSFFGFFDHWQYYFVIIAILSIIIGTFAALDQKKLKTLLAYSSISHMGYAFLAYTSGSFEGVQMLFLYVLIYMLAGLAIWTVVILINTKDKYRYKTNKDLTEFSSLFKSNSALALILTIILLSLAGFPPLIGFFAKTGIFLVLIESSMYFVAIISILCSVISTFYYLRLIKIIFFENKLAGNLFYPIKYSKSIILSLLFFTFIFLFFNPTFIYLFTYKISLLFYTLQV